MLLYGALSFSSLVQFPHAGEPEHGAYAEHICRRIGAKDTVLIRGSASTSYHARILSVATSIPNDSEAIHPGVTDDVQKKPNQLFILVKSILPEEDEGPGINAELRWRNLPVGTCRLTIGVQEASHTN